MQVQKINLVGSTWHHALTELINFDYESLEVKQFPMPVTRSCWNLWFNEVAYIDKHHDDIVEFMNGSSDFNNAGVKFQNDMTKDELQEVRIQLCLSSENCKKLNIYIYNRVDRRELFPFHLLHVDMCTKLEVYSHA
ncbi:hypothetical protein PR048_010713 [Dryococelus australis]|uniref:Uncharacterized protein n=1 Tax=Dryococelus australis TaxID=614101 RepID=A0ABQ9I3I0_9NEOP|nr:hypothetical protein PR048_010713 [Dryococelus australis]